MIPGSQQIVLSHFRDPGCLSPSTGERSKWDVWSGLWTTLLVPLTTFSEIGTTTESLPLSPVTTLKWVRVKGVERTLTFEIRRPPSRYFYLWIWCHLWMTSSLFPCLKNFERVIPLPSEYKVLFVIVTSFPSLWTLRVSGLGVRVSRMGVDYDLVL